MRTKQNLVCAIAVILALAFAALPLAGCKNPAGTNYNTVVRPDDDDDDDDDSLKPSSDLYGTWVTPSTIQITNAPFTLTISATTIKLVGQNGDFIQYDNVKWGAETANTNTNVGPIGD